MGGLKDRFDYTIIKFCLTLKLKSQYTWTARQDVGRVTPSNFPLIFPTCNQAMIIARKFDQLDHMLGLLMTAN